ncbi:MAG TPA: hypothetical protein VFH61_07770 [Thermoleophilia bacterium]|nr:hypothetical protein [Thermoleophilia bacterium]
MTILDAELTFSEDQDLGQIAGTYLSTNVWDSGPLDAGNAGRDIGSGDPMVVQIICGETFIGATATLEIQLVTSAAAALTTPSIHWRSGLLAVDTPSHGLTLGDVIEFAVPIDGGLNPSILQFWGFLYIIATATTTAGTLTTHICRSSIANKAFATGMNIN